jgi:CheY-like chemotaxis protein
MGAPELIDLDFTMVAKLPAVRRETALGPDTEIGAAAGSGNYIFYARAAKARARPAADAPVLVVEDDEIVRGLLERVFKLEGLPVRAAGDSREFSQHLRKPPLPRLVVLDLELPRVSGFRILELVRQQPQTAQIPVVMLSGHAESKHILQAMSLGADGYLSKPVKVATLRAMLARVFPAA